MLIHLPKNNFVQCMMINNYGTDTKLMENAKRISKLPIIYYISMALLNLYYNFSTMAIINDIIYVLYICISVVHMLNLNNELEKIIFQCDAEYVKQYRHIQWFKKNTNKIAYNLVFITFVFDIIILLFGYISLTELFLRSILKISITCNHYMNYLFLANAKQKKLL